MRTDRTLYQVDIVAQNMELLGKTVYNRFGGKGGNTDGV